MPNRIVREGIIDSELVAKLGAHSENFFFRAIIVADDAGRLDGRLTVLASKTYPITSQREADVGKRLNDCVKLGLARVYIWDGKPYVQIMKWQRCSSTQISKFPDERGKYRIEWTKLETRDGEKEFVSSSIDTPSRIAGGGEGVATGSAGGQGDVSKIYGDGDGDGDGDGKTGAKESRPTADDDWLKELQDLEAYRELPVRKEYQKMVQWCSTNHKQPTRKRFINWLNRADKPMNAAPQKQGELREYQPHRRAA
jgi:hypothetical protein